VQTKKDEKEMEGYDSISGGSERGIIEGFRSKGGKP